MCRLETAKQRQEQDGSGGGGHGVHLSPQIHQKYTFRHRGACRTLAESRQEYLTSGIQRDLTIYLSSHSSEVEGERLAILPKITQLTCRSTESLGKLFKLTRLKYQRTAYTGILPKIIELRSESRERSGNLPEITQLRYGSTDRLGYLPPMGWCNIKNVKKKKKFSVRF